MPARQAVLLGQDVSRWVVGYGTEEQIKTALFKTAEVFMPEFELELDNTRGYFTPGGSRSMLDARHYNAPLAIYRNGAVVFEGLVKGVTLENGEKTARIRAGNVISKLADTRASLVADGVNPALAIYGALVDAGFEDLLDAGSFFAAAGPASDAGATVDLDFPASEGSTLLEIITEIADACSLTVYSSGNVIRCQAFQAYQGSGSGLGSEVTRLNARAFGSLEYDDSAFSNRVEVNYAASSTLAIDDKESQAREQVVRSTGLDANTGQSVAIPDLASADFFGSQLLARTSYRRRKLIVELGPEFDGIEVGHRHPVTLANLGLDEEPFEAVEVRKSLTTDDIGVVFVSLS